MVESVASIRSAILHEASRSQPTPLQRATARARESVGPVAGAYLSGAAAVEAQILVTRLDGDIASALASAATVQAAYEATGALVRDAQSRAGGGVSITA